MTLNLICCRSLCQKERRKGKSGSEVSEEKREHVCNVTA